MLLTMHLFIPYNGHLLITVSFILEGGRRPKSFAGRRCILKAIMNEDHDYKRNFKKIQTLCGLAMTSFDFETQLPCTTEYLITWNFVYMFLTSRARTGVKSGWLRLSKHGALFWANQVSCTQLMKIHMGLSTYPIVHGLTL